MRRKSKLTILDRERQIIAAVLRVGVPNEIYLPERRFVTQCQGYHGESLSDLDGNRASTHVNVSNIPTDYQPQLSHSSLFSPVTQ